MIITDSAVHVWKAATPERPWSPGRTAHLPDPISYDKLIAMMDEAGVDRAILVPPSFEGDRTDYSIEAVQHYPDRFAIMGRVPLNKPEGREMMDGWLDLPGMLGVRLTFHHEWDEPWVRDGTADWFWPVAEKLDIPVMVNAPGVLKEMGDIAMSHPKLRLIIDHMGRLRGMKDEALGKGIDKTIELSRLPNVYVKLSLAPTCSTDVYPYRNIHGHLNRLIGAFGPRRSFWGSDLSALLSRSDCTYRQNVTMFTEEMDFLSSEDIEWIMGRGLAECLAWPVAPSLQEKSTA